MRFVCTARRLSGVRCASLVVGLLIAPCLGAQGATASGTLQGTVVGLPRDVALPFAVVSMPQLSIERFTDDAGRFSLGSLSPGRYDVIVRRIGYSPFQGSVQIEAGAVARLDVRLMQIPAQLATTIVRAITSCPRPGAPDRVREPVVASLVSLLRENADRYRLLVKEYPFRYAQLRALGQLGDTALIVEQLDTVAAVGQSKATYRAGKVVNRVSGSRGIPEYVMTLPTILDLADDAFVRNHCFAYGGTSTNEDETWFRLDVRAADRLKTPDVHGSFYIDSASSALRRMELVMSRVDRLPKGLRGVDGVEVMTSFLSIADGLSVIDKVCGMNYWRRTGLRSGSASAVELQQLLGYRFTAPPPGVAVDWMVAAPVGWQRGATLGRSAVWCANGPAG